MAMFALSLTDASNAALRGRGYARRWYAMLGPNKHVLVDARFLLLAPGERNPVVRKGLYRPFMSGLGRPLLTLPVALTFWISAWYVAQDPMPIAIGIACTSRCTADAATLIHSIHLAILTLGTLTYLSAIVFTLLRRDDGNIVAHHEPAMST